MHDDDTFAARWIDLCGGLLGRKTPRGRSRRRKPRLQVEELEARHVLSGTWTPLVNQFPDPTGTTQEMALLSDGSVMMQGGPDGGTANLTWYRLIPDAYGSYVNGQWSPTGLMNYQRNVYSSLVLPDGRLLVLGGEYSGPDLDQNYTNRCEIYDPVADSWMEVAPAPSPPWDSSTGKGGFGDQPSYVLEDGTVLTPNGGNDTQTFLYSPQLNTWVSGPPRLNEDFSYEENWVKLPDNSILAVPTQGSQLQIAQRFVPGATHATDQWVEAGTTVDVLSFPGPPGQEHDTEMGPAVLLPDGRAWQIGGSNLTGLYSPPALTGTASGSWVRGPTVPNDLFGNQLSCADVGAAVMPNGHVIFAAGPWYQTYPATVFEYIPNYNGGIGTITPLVPGAMYFNGIDNEFLTLPNGQILYTNGGYSQLWVYTPEGGPLDAWRPKVKSVSLQGDGTYLLKGKQLNGMSDGGYQGDDAEMASNYPIVRLTKQNGKFFYARSFNWSSVGVQTGKLLVTTQFVLPPMLPIGTYKLKVIASGIASKSFAFEYLGTSTTTGVRFSSAAEKDELSTLFFANYPGKLELASAGAWSQLRQPSAVKESEGKVISTGNQAGNDSLAELTPPPSIHGAVNKATSRQTSAILLGETPFSNPEGPHAS